jgi:hypothetical protein
MLNGRLWSHTSTRCTDRRFNRGICSTLLVTTMTLIALGFVVGWWLRPDIRNWMEAPKYQFVRWSRERGQK